MGDEELCRAFGLTLEEVERRAAEYESGDWSDMAFGPLEPISSVDFEVGPGGIDISLPVPTALALADEALESGKSLGEVITEALVERYVASR